MPIYEYQCAACGHQFELMQNIRNEPQAICPSCQGANVTKLISASGFQLKGTGWYATDYRSKPKNEKTTTESTTNQPEIKSNSDDQSSKTVPDKTKPNGTQST